MMVKCGCLVPVTVWVEVVPTSPEGDPGLSLAMCSECMRPVPASASAPADPGEQDEKQDAENDRGEP